MARKFKRLSAVITLSMLATCTKAGALGRAYQFAGFAAN
jgi:predicted small lipoprotein YifL